MNGKLIVVSGPSGVGKSTVVRKVMESYSNLQFSVSATTRPIRPGEVDGESYFFVSREQFQGMIERDEFLEHAEYVENFYGTPEAPLVESLNNGKDIILDIDVKGALQVKAKRPDAILVFFVAPAFRVIEKRLVERGDTAPDLIERRLQRAKWEYTQASQYDYIVVNDNVDTAANELMSIITAEKCKSKDRLHYLKED